MDNRAQLLPGTLDLLILKAVALGPLSPLRAAQIYDDYRLPNRYNASPTANFSTAEITRRIGGKHKDAVITAARAHAMVSPSEKRQLIELCVGLRGFPSTV